MGDIWYMRFFILIKRLRRVLVLIMSVQIALIMTACDSVVYEEGIENFSKADSSYSINEFLLPSDDFLDDFKYENGQYYFKSIYDYTKKDCNVLDRSIVICEYNQDVYENAKKYCLDEMNLSDSNVIEYNGYIFIENLKHFEERKQLEGGKNTGYPRWFNMLVYNDDKECLAFIGFYCSKSPEFALTDWDKFLEEYFSEYYNFSD